MAKIKPREWARKSAEERARLEAEAEAPKAKPASTKPDIEPGRLAEIRADAWTHGRNWAAVVNYGPACSCGLKRFGGICARHGDYNPKEGS